jgi:RHS repeat-associated protein
MLAEYSTIVESQSTAKVSYLTSDHLGSPRILTDANGNVISRRDFHPFGEEIIIAQRTQGLDYTADSVRQKFTSYERDVEIDLDFAQARYYNSMHGRFTSPDPFGPWAMSEGEKMSFYIVPQQWNRYTYVLNNPLKLTDPTGMEVYDETVSEEQQRIIRQALENIAKFGNKEQRVIANWILKNNILITLVASASTISGSAGLQSGSAGALSQRLQKGYLSKEEAASYLQIRLNEGIVGTSEIAQAALEGTLVHEGRHAWVDALSIQSISSDCGPRCYYSISQFTDEQKAFQSEATYLLSRANSGREAYKQVGLGANGRYNFLSEENGRLKVNEEKIRNILSSEYNLNENNQGLSTIQKFERLGVQIPQRGKK